MWQRMKKTEAYRYDDGLFHVTEIFDSIDGEGKRTGLMAIFVRLAGCNLRCSYCDTAYSLSLTDTAEALTEEELLSRIHAFPWKKITLTGGEPMLHPIRHLCEVLGKEGYEWRGGPLPRAAAGDILHDGLQMRRKRHEGTDAGGKFQPPWERGCAEIRREL